MFGLPVGLPGDQRRREIDRKVAEAEEDERLAQAPQHLHRPEALQVYMPVLVQTVPRGGGDIDRKGPVFVAGKDGATIIVRDPRFTRTDCKVTHGLFFFVSHPLIRRRVVQ